MSEEDIGARASEYESDPLHISESSKSPDLDYRWVRVVEGNPRWLWRGHDSKGWLSVPRSAMPEEKSAEENFIQRIEMRLFSREKIISDKERKIDEERALNQVKICEDRNHKFFVPQTPLNPIPFSMPLSLRSGIFKEKKSKWIFVVFQDSEERCIFSPVRAIKWVVFRYPLFLARYRIVSLSCDEIEVAYLQGTSYGVWGVFKLEMLRQRRRIYRLTRRTGKHIIKDY